MKTRTENPKKAFRQRAGAAFSLVELTVAVGVSGVMFLSLYAGMSSGFAVAQLARENLRAGQILQERMETIRLYTWEQINTPGFIPTNFTDSFHFASTQSSGGLIYTGTVTIAAAPITEPYSSDLRQVTVELQWESAHVLRKREMTTFVSQYGLQNYIYY
ncbi:MAG: hypothetical protein HYY23_08235 [Verrucomicrobia bacterium]|nr:hypothetical protein [Verrucomicrobiota bacterium]